MTKTVKEWIELIKTQDSVEQVKSTRSLYQLNIQKLECIELLEWIHQHLTILKVSLFNPETA